MSWGAGGSQRVQQTKKPQRRAGLQPQAPGALQAPLAGAPGHGQPLLARLQAAAPAQVGLGAAEAGAQRQPLVAACGLHRVRQHVTGKARRWAAAAQHEPLQVELGEVGREQEQAQPQVGQEQGPLAAALDPQDEQHAATQQPKPAKAAWQDVERPQAESMAGTAVAPDQAVGNGLGERPRQRVGDRCGDRFFERGRLERGRTGLRMRRRTRP